MFWILNDLLGAFQAALKSLRFEMSDKEKRKRKEIEALKKAASDREKDLDTLTIVIQSNQDTIHVIHTNLRIYIWFFTIVFELTPLYHLLALGFARGTGREQWSAKEDRQREKDVEKEGADSSCCAAREQHFAL